MKGKVFKWRVVEKWNAFHGPGEIDQNPTLIRARLGLAKPQGRGLLIP